jgi:16S rRNA (cytosine1402-N4)-methyltransferase
VSIPSDASPVPAPAGDPGHVPVLLREVVEHLAPQPGEVVVDCTAGRGGHALAMAGLIGRSGTLVLVDADAANLAFAEARVVAGVPEDARPTVIALHANFADAPRLLAERSLTADAVLADLGFSSTHMDDAERGFAFRHAGPLDMRYDTGRPLTAAMIVNTWPEEELAELIRDYGEDRAAHRIAGAIVRRRAQSPLTTTTELAAVVRSVLPPKQQGGIDPATRTFQALRIAVNDELGSLRSLLESIGRVAGALATDRGRATARHWLRPGARVGIISFHSLEDRAIKHAFADCVDRGLATHRTRKPVAPGEAETAANPRARSAKLRVIQLATR